MMVIATSVMTMAGLATGDCRISHVAGHVRAGGGVFVRYMSERVARSLDRLVIVPSRARRISNQKKSQRSKGEV
jgi:hypothetical protein